MSKGSILTGFLCLLVLSFFAAAAENELSSVPETEQKFLGDESDGSRATPVHLIPLFPEDELGQKGGQIDPGAENPLPFSTRFTCIECHNYDLVKMGWHFNAVDANVPPGRPGQPWIYFDSKLCIQIPISYRNWPGTYRPEQIGLTDFRFTKIFGRHMPGGGPGEVEATDIDDIGRQLVAGRLEINCLACHSTHPGQDMGGTNGYAVQISRENFRWAATASCEFASVTGSAAALPITYDPFMPDPSETDAPKVTYRKEAFNENNEVLFEIVREVPNERCYYCHSNLYQTNADGKTEKWIQDEDVHLKAGLKCVDCHRNGIGHNIIRGYTDESGISDNPLAAVSTCEGCHLPVDDNIPEAGRLGAPVPTHPGIPAVHFDKLTCTACHSGPWPAKETILTKTSRAHRLGTPNVSKAPESLPHILTPVFAKEGGIVVDNAGKTLSLEDRKIAPHKLIWPVFWGVSVDNNIRPVEIQIVEKVVGDAFAELELSAAGDWPELTKEQIADVLKALGPEVEGAAVYICGGKLYTLDDTGQLSEQQNHPAAQPYLWPLAHNVRPAAQALGVRYCTDCHAVDSPLFFGDVAVDSSIAAESGSTRQMTEFMAVQPLYNKVFAFTFVFRTFMKIVCIGSSLILTGVLLLYALRALRCAVRVLSGNDK